MFVCNELIYIQLQKTGCTHIASLFSKLFDGDVVGKHNAATPEQLESTEYFVSSIRNPWDWYLSLWTYGVQGVGAVRHRLTERKFRKPSGSIFRNSKKLFQVNYDELTKDVKTWRSVYSRSDDVEAFRRWLRLIHDHNNSRYLGEGYGDTAITDQCGFMTYRYLHLCCKNVQELNSSGVIANYNELVQFDRDNCYIDYFIKQEALESGVCEAVEHVRPLAQSEREMIFGSSKTNTSVRKLSLADYYDKESIDLILSRDRLIIEKFNYLPPK